MDDLNLTEALGQVSASEAGVIFRNFLRGGVRQMICEVMAAEVTRSIVSPTLIATIMVL